MAKVGKKYAEAAKLIDRSKAYSIEEAVKLAKETNVAKFDASVEVCFKLNVDPRHADQQIRGAMVLPHGTGKSAKVCVITQGPKEQEAKDAGADFVGGKELLEEIKKGKVEYRTDKAGNINLMIGKVSFSDEQLVDNFKAIYNTVVKARPAAVKGTYIKNLVMATTMGPGIHVEIVK